MIREPWIPKRLQFQYIEESILSSLETKDTYRCSSINEKLSIQKIQQISRYRKRIRDIFRPEIQDVVDEAEKKSKEEEKKREEEMNDESEEDSRRISSWFQIGLWYVF